MCRVTTGVTLAANSAAAASAWPATVLSEMAQLLAHYGVQPGAFIYVADAALVTEDNLAALRETLFITR